MKAKLVITLVLLIRGIKKEEIERGIVVATPGTITPHKKFKCSSLYFEQR